jgi:Flp pilus assembly protein TadG
VRLRKRFQRSEDGAAMVEFALVIGLFVLVLYGLIAYGLALDLKQNMTHAATEGARAAIGAVPIGTETPDQAAERVAKDAVTRAMSSFKQFDTSTMVEAHADAAQCQPNPPTPTAECITVTIKYPYKDKPIVPSAPGLGVVIPDTMTTKAVVELHD